MLTAVKKISFRYCGRDCALNCVFVFVAPGTVADHRYPSLTKNYHYEAELVACLNKGGRNIKVADALSHVYGYTLGLDMTRRDLQRAMGDEKKPWDRQEF